MARINCCLLTNPLFITSQNLNDFNKAPYAVRGNFALCSNLLTKSF